MLKYSLWYTIMTNYISIWNLYQLLLSYDGSIISQNKNGWMLTFMTICVKQGYIQRGFGSQDNTFSMFGE